MVPTSCTPTRAGPRGPRQHKCVPVHFLRRARSSRPSPHETQPLFPAARSANSIVVGKRPRRPIGLMPTLSLRWFFAVLAVFVITLGADTWLSRQNTPAADAAGARVEVA